MKLAFCLFKYFPFGGLQRDFLRTAEECQRRGHTVHVYTMEWQGAMPHHLPVTLIPIHGLGNHRRCLSFTQQLAAYLQNESYDLVIGFNKMPGLDVYYAADPCYAAKTQGERPWYYRLTPRYRTYTQLENTVFTPTARTEILTLTEFQQAQFIQFYQTPTERFHLLPPGVNPQRKPPTNAAEIRATVRETFKITPDNYCLLMVGSGFKTKGVDRALLALHSLPTELRKKTHLLIIGQGDTKTYLRAAKHLGITEQVRFLGGRKKVAPFFLAADLLLHPAYSETAGMVLVEALVTGLPVLTTEACGYAKHVQRARAGVVLPLPFQQTELNQQLAVILNSERRKFWQKNALAYAAKTDLYSLVEKAVDFLESLGNKKNVGWAKRSVPTEQSNGGHGLRPLPTLQSDFELNPELRIYFHNKNIFTKIFKLQGEIFRHEKNRKTLRFEIQGNAYFAKLHSGVGWKEIFKNLLQGRWPIVSAKHEWLAIQRLTELNINTTPLAGYGKHGKNPARLQSFVITHAINNAVSLEDFCRDWPLQPPAPNLKRTLLADVARIAQQMHTHGVNHRDFYICHFLLDLKNDPSKNPKLYLIDLHRAHCRTRTPKRWLIKDLAGLYFSSLDIGLTSRDFLRFIKIYSEQPLRRCLQKNRRLWRSVEKRALRLYAKTERKNLAAIATQNQFSPFTLACSQTPIIMRCEQLMRVIPHKRWVFFARWNNQDIVAKCFKRPRDAARELQGYHALIEAGIHTPNLLFHGWSRGGNFYILLYQRIMPAQDFAASWAQANIATQQQLFTDLLLLIAQHHDAGIRQCDLHFKNFLLGNNKIYTLDAADIIKTDHPLTGSQSLNNLALLFAQLPPQSERTFEEFYRVYAQARGILFTLTDLIDLKKYLVYWQKYRLLAYGRKIFRSSTALVCRRSWRHFLVCDRTYDTAAMRLFLADPETVLQGPAVKILKAGHTCTVALIEISGRQLVVKRYNIKNFWHRLKRAIQPTRAARSWRNAHRLLLAGIPTAKPVALLEKRCGPLRGTSYFISEYIAGTRLDAYLTETSTPEEQLFISEKILALFKRLADMRLSHGDLKATNILMVGSEPFLIDLDAMRLHQLNWRWRKARQRDWQRFLKNWQNEPEIQKTFERVLENII
jgi:UDP-glucose:(heptosyl)LPS alpha-1,3-glucosyltransferase